MESSSPRACAALPLAACAPTPEASPDAPWFRVEADWPGGGFNYTLQFESALAATEWATARVGHRRGATVIVEQRGAIDCAELSAAEVDAIAADLHINAMKNSGEWDQRRRDAGCLDAERARNAAWGWK